MEPHVSLPVNEGTQNPVAPASLDTAGSQTRIQMSKGQPLNSPSIARRRGSSKRGITSTVIKRSASSPNVREMESGEASNMSMSDKRRNKLGYHRTSVACGHCRRRKIRCLLAPGDPQRRCSNCIRLKKECNFYPVDQQPPLDNRARSGSKAEVSSSNGAGTSAASSPEHYAESQMVEQVEGYHHLQPHPLQTNQESQSFDPYSASTVSPPERTPMSGLGYDFPQAFATSPPWEHSSFMSHSPQTQVIDRPFAGEAAGSLWRQNGSPLTGAYPASLISMNSSSISMTASSQGSREALFSHGAREDRSRHLPPAPMRSMSLVTPEELPPQYQARFFQQSQHAADRTAVTAGVAAHPLYPHATHDTSAYGPHSSMEINSIEQQGGVGHQTDFAFSQWSGYPQQNTQMVDPGTEGFSREWYAGSANLGQVREDDSGPHHFPPPSGLALHRRYPA